VCVRGASALGRALAKAGDDVQTVVVWMPVVPGDSFRAASRASARLAGTRVTQFWDENGTVSAALLSAGREAGWLRPEDVAGPEGEEFLWDLVAWIPAGARWDEWTGPPAPAWYGTPVEKSLDALRTRLGPVGPRP
jgi:hypothetical protein